MRITFEIAEETKTALADIAAHEDLAVEDGGAAPGGGEGLSDAAEDADMGPPPNWLVAAVEAAILSEGVAGDASTASGELLEGGQAPD